ncbi:MAG: TraR/DksA C4-type zinc finger protein [Candidatus Omnitrophica bacterium]|nr:TraR/DksA C4-type zinc finger protein [Candidatus Omnitrophota bacterium]
MTKRELAKFKQLLIKEKAHVLEEIKHIAKDAAKSHRDTSGDISTYTYHMADVASDHYERELSLNIATGEQRILYAIDEALKRVEDATYGLCLECGKPIPTRRLQAVPYAPMCIACQRGQESKSKRNADS